VVLEGGVYHMFSAEMADRCSLGVWTFKSQASRYLEARNYTIHSNNTTHTSGIQTPDSRLSLSSPSTPVPCNMYANVCTLEDRRIL